MRLQLILCDMLALPAEHLAAESPHEIIVTDLSASLHVEPLPLRDRIQEHIDRIEADLGGQPCQASLIPIHQDQVGPLLYTQAQGQFSSQTSGRAGDQHGAAAQAYPAHC